MKNKLEHFKTIHTNDDVCAYDVKKTGGTCLDLKTVESMIVAYNKYIKSHHSTHLQYIINLNNYEALKKNNIITYKQKLTRLLSDNLKSLGLCKSGEQTCWLTLPMFYDIEKLHTSTFKPIGPKNSNEWLNTMHILDVFEHYERIYPDFKFLGAVPRDFYTVDAQFRKSFNLKKFIDEGIFRLGIVFNLDKSNQSGSHWVSMFVNLLLKQIYYFDSVGSKPLKELKNFMDIIESFIKTNVVDEYCQHNSGNKYCMKLKNNNKIDVRYNDVQHQRGNSECGVYSITFILRMLDGETFDDIKKHVVTDEEIEQCRAIYFRDPSAEEKIYS